MEGLPDFAGKIVTVYLRNAPRAYENGCILESPSYREIGGKLFIQGRIPEQSGSEWATDLQFGAQWDEVIGYLVFDSREDYMVRLGNYRPSLWERLGFR